jgi:hypothetical protein
MDHVGPICDGELCEFSLFVSSIAQRCVLKKMQLIPWILLVFDLHYCGCVCEICEFKFFVIIDNDGICRQLRGSLLLQALVTTESWTRSP